MHRLLSFTFALCVAWLATCPALAHPVTKDHHDRTIVVRLQKAAAPNQIRVRVEYRLEVDEGTIIDRDMKPFRDEVNPFDYRGEPLKYYARFAEKYAPIYANFLVARIDKEKPLTFRCVSHTERLDDEEGKGLGHLRCDFVFEAMFELPSERKTTLSFYEKNYWGQDGAIFLTLVNETELATEGRIAPDEALWKRAKDNPEPDDDDRLREVKLTLVPMMPSTPAKTEESPPPSPREPHEGHVDPFDLRRLILHTGYGFWLIMILAFLFGAAHALTPGHGKTLVAAYLVGERGTIWHAIYLGVVTTLTHTGVVMALAIILTFLPDHLQQTFRHWIQNGLGLIMGLMVTCMGFWLLLQRLAGRADHIHLDGGHHHHRDATPPSARTLSWWGLTLLGMTGGMIPCWDAVGVLGITVGTNEIWLVLPAVLVFSAGLAAVLVLIGVLVVQVPRFVESRFGGGRLLRALPIVSAILVTLMGLWLCYEGVHGR